MNIVIDMNLSPDWEAVFREADCAAVHWSRVGDATAVDEEILAWARTNDHVVFTHDLDFGAILAASGADSPSVLQVRGADVSPRHMGTLMLGALVQFRDALQSGVLISIDERRSRARLLPLGPGTS